jgi:cytochrome c biogenesis factor
MQKSNDTGSILLWSICISLVLVFLFASFSTKLSEKIRFEKSLVGIVQTIFQEDSLIE